MDTANIRKERIERLLLDLKYEITRGMMEGEIEETIRYGFAVPSKSKSHSMVRCEFYCCPSDYPPMMDGSKGPSLKIAGGTDAG